MKKLKNLKSQIDTISKIQRDYEDIGILIDMGNEEEDMSIVEDVKEQLNEFIENFEKTKIDTLYQENMTNVTQFLN